MAADLCKVGGPETAEQTWRETILTLSGAFDGIAANKSMSNSLFRVLAVMTSKKSNRRWSAEVTRHSNALDLKPGVFTLKSPKQIAASLKHSAETSRRKKTDAFRSALSMLTFYINRAGTNLSATQRRALMRAKDELRKQFGRE